MVNGALRRLPGLIDKRAATYARRAISERLEEIAVLRFCEHFDRDSRRMLMRPLMLAAQSILTPLQPQGR